MSEQQSQPQQKINRLNIGKKTDLFEVIAFDHLEYWASDAKTTMKALKVGCGLELIGHSMHETGNHIYSSYVLQTNNIKWIVTAPYLSEFIHPEQKCPHPKFEPDSVRKFVEKHGSGVAAIGIKVGNAKEAYEISTKNGAKGVTPPKELKDEKEKGSLVLSEIYIYGDTILRFMEYKDGYSGPFLPGYERVKDDHPLNYGLQRMDHVVGNVPVLQEVENNIKNWLGFHIFAAFTKEDIATEWTSLNSTVMANNYDTVLLPLNEPAKKKRESQITEFLKAYNGPGVQHIAIFSKEILKSLEMMRAVSYMGGFEFIPTPEEYYKDEVVVKLMNEYLSEDARKLAKEYGLLIDKDDEGVLLQIFTRPLFDRPTIFIEIIQRLCHGEVVDKPGCGGFGKGNFRALFQSIERMQAARGMLLEDNE